MTIKFIDPQAMEKTGNSQSVPKPEPETKTKTESRPRTKRLVDVDEKLGESLSKFESQLEKVQDLNARLFGNEKAKAESQRGKSSGQNKGLIPSIDAKIEEFEDLLGRLESEIAAVEALA